MKRTKNTTIVQELNKFVPWMNIIVNGEVNKHNWRAFKGKYKFTSASMAAPIREAGGFYLKSKMVKEDKN